MVKLRPERGSHAPGTFFYSNNWDFNAAGTVFTQLTGKEIFAERTPPAAGATGKLYTMIGAARTRHK